MTFSSDNVYKGKYKYKYVPYGTGAIAILQDATMKFTEPKEFNDPFDCLPSYTHSLNNPFTKKFPGPYKELSKQLKLSPAQRLQQRGKYEAILKIKVDNGFWQQENQKNIGICSMSTKPCNLLMWSHYAKNHTGVVFEFKNETPTAAILHRHYLFSFEVIYKKEKPIIDIADANPTHDLLIKAIDWEYESEVRCLAIEDGKGIHGYKRELLSSVILGARMSIQDETSIRDIVNDVNKKFSLSIKVYKAQISQSEFKIIIPDHPEHH